MAESEVKAFLVRYPDYEKILRKAVEYEEAHSKEQYFLGWAWSDVEAFPTRLIRLVTEGISQISYRSRRYTNYKLKDREAVKRALKSLG